VFGDAINDAEKKDSKPAEGEAGAEDEDAEDMQIAWENLETARTIYENSGANHLELARVYMKLGDVSMVNENFEQAVSDFEKCLAIREEHCEPHSQRLADVHSALWEAHGMASANSDKDHVGPYLHHLRKSLEVLQACLNKHQADIVAVKSGLKDPEGRTIEELTAKVEELNEVIPEVKETIAAAQESDASTAALKEHIKDTTAETTAPVTTTGFGGFAMPSTAAASAPVTTLKARSKRKPTAAADEPAAKAAKPDDDKKAALMARMGGSGEGSTSFGFGTSAGSSTSFGFGTTTTGF